MLGPFFVHFNAQSFCRIPFPKYDSTVHTCDESFKSEVNMIQWASGKSIERFLTFLKSAAFVVLLVLFSPSFLFAAEPGNIAWSSSDTSMTPQGSVKFHGPFTNETVNVTSTQLDKHSFLDISFDLLILRSWDGSLPIGSTSIPGPIGPDFIRVKMQDGPTLLFNTFSNTPLTRDFRNDSKQQSFPSPIPGNAFDPQTGAAAKNSLGYNYAWVGPPQPIPMDATYSIHLIVPHDAPQAVVQLSGLGLQNIIDECWGITNLKIKPLTDEAVKTPTLEEIDLAFKDASDTQGDKQQAGMQKLILGMNNTVTYLRANVAPQPLDGDHVKQLIENLGVDDTQANVRESAVSELRSLGVATEPFLRDAEKTAIGDRLACIDWQLEIIGITPIPDANLQSVALATRVLEVIGTPEALELRRQLVSK
jgi:hypothetical protein